MLASDGNITPMVDVLVRVTQPQCPAGLPGQGLHDGKPEAGARLASCDIGAGESPGSGIEKVSRHARASI